MTPAERLRALRLALPPVVGPLRSREPVRQLVAELRLERSVDESLKATPLQAGPLNSQGVVVRALQRLNAASPPYVRALVAQLEALAALESATQSGG